MNMAISCVQMKRRDILKCEDSTICVVCPSSIVQDKGEIFNDRVHHEIESALILYGKEASLDSPLLQRIHELRVYAESEIPKPTMKAYKAMLRDGLFG